MNEPVDALDPAYRRVVRPPAAPHLTLPPPTGPRQTLPPPTGLRWIPPPPTAPPLAVPRMPLGSDHRQLGRWLTVLLAACAAVSLLEVLLNLYGIWLLDRWRVDASSIILADGEHFDTVDGLLTWLLLLVTLATAVATLIWLYQAYGSREADPARLTYQRWWTIGGWFVPVISLFRPYQLFRDLYLATAGSPPPEQPGARVRCPTSFRWWWLCLLTGNVLSKAANRMITDGSDLAQIEAALALVVVSQLLLIAAAVLFIRMLRLISSNLWRRAQLAKSQIAQSQIAQSQIAKCSSESTATATNTSVR